jgi:hypothetical protein
MISINQIYSPKNTHHIVPIEFNLNPDTYIWKNRKVIVWFGLSEMESIPSLFISQNCGQKIVIPIQLLNSLLSLPIVDELMKGA